jgi:hypothetical protein
VSAETWSREFASELERFVSVKRTCAVSRGFASGFARGFVVGFARGFVSGLDRFKFRLEGFVVMKLI